jgi:transcriptional regulator with XRE-family HTH domain
MFWVSDIPEFDSATESLVNLISSLRQDLGLTLEELADRAGIHRTSLGLIERGERGLSVATANKLAKALDFTLGNLINLSEKDFSMSIKEMTPPSPRYVPATVIRNSDELKALIGISSNSIMEAVVEVYNTLDLIDLELISRKSEPISALVELANLSSMVGNLIGASVAEKSQGKYKRNRPHAFPDLIPQNSELPDLEIKIALESNRPKGHLPKEGTYLTFRYVLGNKNGEYIRGKENRGKTVWIWEVRAGFLGLNDFDISNTPGDSGKTAVIKTEPFKRMLVVFFDPRFFPYASNWGGLGT